MNKTIKLTRNKTLSLKTINNDQQLFGLYNSWTRKTDNAGLYLSIYLFGKGLVFEIMDRRYWDNPKSHWKSYEDTLKDIEVERKEEETENVEYITRLIKYATRRRVNKDYINENSLIKLSIENRIEDILFQLTKVEKEHVKQIQSITLKFLNDTVNELIAILSLNLSQQEVKEKYKDFVFLNLILKYMGKEIYLKELQTSVGENILKKTIKLQKAKKFIEENK